MNALWHDGHLLSQVNWCREVSGRTLHALVSVPSHSALDEARMGPWPKREFAKIRALGVAPPRKRLIAGDEKGFLLNWKRAPALYVYTDSLESHPYVVRSASRGTVVPTFLLPIPHESKQYLSTWASNVQEIDSIWLTSSDALEVATYRELADPKSSLNVIGEEHRAEIEAATGKPTYLHLYRYFGAKDEKARECPRCGRRMRRTPQAKRLLPPGDGGLLSFGARCESCRTVTSDPVDDERPDLASIGRWHPTSKTRVRRK